MMLAEKSLELAPDTVDAHAARAEAATRLGKISIAKEAFNRLCELAPREALGLHPLLAELGLSVDPPDLGGEERKPNPEADQNRIEHQLAMGSALPALAAMERHATLHMERSQISEAAGGLAALSVMASSYLTTAPVFANFAPFDLSLWSIARLEAALYTLYGNKARPGVDTDPSALRILTGAYLGETLRSTTRGRWAGTTANLSEAAVLIEKQSFSPIEAMKDRIDYGRSEALDSLREQLPKVGRPWTRFSRNPVSGPYSWGPKPWPRPSDLEVIGHTLPQTSVGVYCRRSALCELDFGVKSVGAIDQYLDLIAPERAQSDPDAAWPRRVAVMVGCYIGETLRMAVGGDWSFGVDIAGDGGSYRLKLGNGNECTPILEVLGRLNSARKSNLQDYVQDLLHDANHRN